MAELLQDDSFRRYYQNLDQLFGVTTAAVIGLCVLSLPFLSLAGSDVTRYLVVVGLATGLFLLRFGVWGGSRQGELRYYLTDVISPVLIGALVTISHHFGLYLYFLFFLHVVGSIALLRFRHVALSVAVISAWSVYLFFVTDNFALGSPERFIAGTIVLMTLLVMTVFIYVLVHELVWRLLSLEARERQFMQDVSHELRTPLTVMKAVGELMVRAQGPVRAGGRAGKAALSRRKMIRYFESATRDLETITERLSGNTKKRPPEEDGE